MMFKLEKTLLRILIMIVVFVLSSFFNQNGLAEYVNPVVGDETNAAYWLDRGGLYATYGNYSAAVKAYKKALALNQIDSTVYFNISLAYCEIEAYDEALIAAEKALLMEPQNGDYHYGLAWILLKAGKKIEAQRQFHQAADLSNQDALDYLQYHN